MNKDQLFIDMAHLAYGGYVPKAKLDEIAGKASWEPENDVFPEWEEPLTLDNDLTPAEQFQRLCYLRDNK